MDKTLQESEKTMVILFNSESNSHSQTVKMASTMNRLDVETVDLSTLSSSKSAFSNALRVLGTGINWTKLNGTLPESICTQQHTSDEVFDHLLRGIDRLAHPIAIHNQQAYFLPMPNLYMQEVWQDDKFTPENQIKKDPNEL